MAAKGWVGLWRGMADSQMWLAEPFTFGQAWADLMMLAAWETDEKPSLRAGDVCETVRGLAGRWQWNRYRTEKFLRQLADRGWIRLYASTGLPRQEPEMCVPAPEGFDSLKDAGRPTALLRIEMDADGLMAEMSRVFDWGQRNGAFSTESSRIFTGDPAEGQPEEDLEKEGTSEAPAARVQAESQPDFSHISAGMRTEEENEAETEDHPEANAEGKDPASGQISARRVERTRPGVDVENKSGNGGSSAGFSPEVSRISAGHSKNSSHYSSGKHTRASSPPPLSSPLKGGKGKEEGKRRVPSEFADRFANWEEYFAWRYQ